MKFFMKHHVSVAKGRIAPGRKSNDSFLKNVYEYVCGFVEKLTRERQSEILLFSGYHRVAEMSYRSSFLYNRSFIVQYLWSKRRRRIFQTNPLPAK
jgi:hypothetical protein